MKDKRVAVVGSTGFIGKHLVRRLLRSRVQVLSIARRNLELPGITHVKADIRKQGTIDKIISTKPDTLILLAGISGQTNTETHEKESSSVNVIAQIAILDAVAKNLPRCHVIFSSSRLEYGKPQYLPVDESHPTSPLSAYGRQKKQVTEYCLKLYKSRGLPVTILRTSNVYGPHPIGTKPTYNIVNYFIDQVLYNETVSIYGKGGQLRDQLYIDDFVAAVMSTLNSPRSLGQVYNVGSGVGIPIIKIANLIIKFAGKGRIKTIPWPTEEKLVETGDYVSDIRKITRDLGWRPRITIEEGIKKTLKVMKMS